MNNRIRTKIFDIGNILIPVTLAFGVGAVFCLMIGYNPWTVFGVIIRGGFGSKAGWMQTLGFSCPIIMTSMATALCFKGGVWNLGMEGQLYMGAYAAALVAGGYYGMSSIPAGLQIPIALAVSMGVGVLYALIPGLLKAYLNTNVVVTTIMFNYVAIGLTEFMCKAFHQGDQSYDATFKIMSTATIPKLNESYRVTYAIFAAVFIAVVITFVMKKTRFGYELSAIGVQQEFAEATGMRVKRKIVQVFMVSGAVAGLAGATEVTGVNKNFTPNFSKDPGLGWEGYFVAVLTNNNPVACFFVAILFGGFRYGSIVAQSNLGISLDLLNIIKACLILFYAVKYLNGSNGRIKKAVRSWPGRLRNKDSGTREGAKIEKGGDTVG
ncbi:ABC transporter permease [Diplocloster agilis]|uniref:ABC transporter permease n=1 Tax=Diplocloster agilis TaxID=2850323 RepID=UPI0008221F75|nr:ABC transporter permease [Suonthocola fibrivorans]MCU6735779.1 ABC transporter permease [Suonthocola fibrivorans]SCJ81627.1 Galactoside transport system permease protein mglC [uncultured Clostridium sp.]